MLMSEKVSLFLLVLLGAFADPFLRFAYAANSGVVLQADGDGFGFSIGFELQDEPVAVFQQGEEGFYL